MKEYAWEERRQESEPQKADYFLTWLWLAGTSIALLAALLVVKNIWPDAIPFGIFEFWKAGMILVGIKAVWWVFLWGAGITVLHAVLTRNRPWDNDEAESIFAFGTISSIMAGVLEEIKYRWLLFFTGIIAVQISNFLFFGWLGFGITEWLFWNIFGPVVNFLTLGKIGWILFHPAGWFVGSAVLLANAKFRAGHKYLGIFGYLNSWFMGFVMFWLMFTYGLWAAIVVHFLYDFLIHLVLYLDMVVERRFLDR